MSLFGSLAGLGGTALGAFVGSMIFPGIGTAIGALIGGSLGSLAGNYLFPEKYDLNLPPPPQPQENRVQISTYGESIPIVYGSSRLAGNIIYMQDVVEDVDRSRHRQDGVRYYEMVKTYTSTFAVAFCEGPVVGFGRIWVNNKIFADWRDPDGPYYPTGSTGLATGNLDTSIARGSVNFSMYFGTEDQAADPTLSALLGAENTPAYKGICYIVFINFPVGEYSGVPTIEVELAEEEDIYPTSPSLNPDYADVWETYDLTTFTENDLSNDISVNSASANIVRSGSDFDDCWIEKDLSAGEYSFRFKVQINSIGTMTNSSRVLRLLNFVISATPYPVVNFYFDDGPASYDYAIGIGLESASQHYSSATLTRYIEVIQDKAATEVTINIYTDSGFSTLEFSDSATNAAYANDITKIEMLDAYNATGIAYDIQVENVQYQIHN